MKKQIDLESLEKYSDPVDRKIFETAALVEAEGYMRMTRIEEIVRFCELMGYKRIGIAFCIGLEEEAKILHSVLKQHVKVSSACCKVCGVDKDDMEIVKVENEDFEAICNPIGQSEILDKCGSDLNLICGLCLGHDMLFSKHSKAPVTTFIVKDRVLSHNPAGALYTKYYKRRMLPEDKKT